MSSLVEGFKRRVPKPARALLKRWLFWLRNRGFNPYVADFEKDEESFRFFVGDRIGEMWFQGGWDWTEVNFLRDYLVRSGDVVFECGAHHGEITMLLSRWVGPAGKVIAFEPVPRNASIIERQIALNQLNNVTLVNAAVGADPGTIRMTDESNAQVSTGPGIQVAVVRLDDFVHLEPTLLKIDVEGHELHLLKGAKEILKRRPRIALEIHTSLLSLYGISYEEVFAIVDAPGYSWKVHQPGTENVRDWTGEPQGRAVHLFGIPLDEALAQEQDKVIN